jgi:hypothetical protein
MHLRRVVSLVSSAEMEYQASHLATEALRVKRNRLVCEAVEAGVSQADIARITGLTTARINQIVKQ